MTPTHATPSPMIMLAVYVAVAALLVYRFSRPMKMSVMRLFIMPVVLLAITVVSIWTGQRLHPAPAWEIAVALAIGALLGIPLGVAMSAHRTVRRTERPHIMFVDPSWLTAAIWIGAFIVRSVLRAMLPVGAFGTVVGDGLLLFAIAAVITSYWVIYQKFRALDEAAPATS